MTITEIAYSFFIYSFIGWLLEVVSESIRQGKPVNRGFMNGPFCSIYGFGALIMIIFVRTTGATPMEIFAFGTIFLSLVEYATSVVMESMFGARWWSYSGQPLNINGRISLFCSVVWGLAALFAMEFIQPFIAKLVALYLSLGYSVAISLIISAYFLVDFSLSLASSIGLKKSLSVIKSEIPMIGDKNFMSRSELTRDFKAMIIGVIPKLPLGQKRILIAFPDLVNDTAKKWAANGKKIIDRISR
ncbi:MAG: putative ABC transporter permease [Candidatus Colwellbacteria bacterium]|nr:putative ABC transporter permease [Candidatus Colwellbacteria bacterium]